MKERKCGLIAFVWLARWQCIMQTLAISMAKSRWVTDCCDHSDVDAMASEILAARFKSLDARSCVPSTISGRDPVQFATGYLEQRFLMLSIPA